MGNKSVAFGPKFNLRATVIARLVEKAKKERIGSFVSSPKSAGVPRDAIVGPLNTMESITIVRDDSFEFMMLV